MPDGSGHQLDERARRVLEFERSAWGHSPAKERRIRAEFGWSPARYYQVLNAIVDDVAALAHDPVLVNRLREVRAGRDAKRRARRDAAS